jgi:hypothetical protein
VLAIIGYLISVIFMCLIVSRSGYTLPHVGHDDIIWHMHFDGAHSSEGKGAGIVLYHPFGKIHNFSYRLEFACKNNVVKFEALILGLEKTINLGYQC